jgi:hypothetical protein
MDPRKLKVNELKEQLQLAGLSVNGKKEELITRLLEHQKAEEEALNASVAPTGSGESYDWDESVEYVILSAKLMNETAQRNVRTK